MSEVGRWREERNRLEARHAVVMAELYRELAAHNNARWDDLPYGEQWEIISIAHELCEKWEDSPELHGAPDASLSPVMRLVTEQHRIVENILRAEDRRIRAIGREGPAVTASPTPTIH